MSLEQATSKLREIGARAESLLSEFEETNDEEKMPFLEAKIQLTLNYQILLTYYIKEKSKMLAASDSRTLDPSLFKELYRIRLVLRKLKPLEGKLKYSINRLVEQANTSNKVNRAAPGAELRNSIMAGESEETEKEEGGLQKKEESNSGLYQAPKISQVEFSNDNSYAATEAKAQRNLDRQERKVRNSQFFQALRETVGESSDAPMRGTNSGLMMGKSSNYSERNLADEDGKEAKRLMKKFEERSKFAEDNPLLRVKGMNKQDKKDLKKLKQLKMNRGGSGCVAMEDVLGDVRGGFGSKRLGELKQAREKLGVIKGAKKVQKR